MDAKPCVAGPVTCPKPVRPRLDSIPSEPAALGSWDKRDAQAGGQRLCGCDGDASPYPLSSPSSTRPRLVVSSRGERRRHRHSRGERGRHCRRRGVRGRHQRSRGERHKHSQGERRRHGHFIARERRTRSLDRLSQSLLTPCCSSGGREDDFAGGCPCPRTFGQEGDAYDCCSQHSRVAAVNTPVAPGSVSGHFTGAMVVEGWHREGETLPGCSIGLQGVDGHSEQLKGASDGVGPVCPAAWKKACNLGREVGKGGLRVAPLLS